MPDGGARWYSDGADEEETAPLVGSGASGDGEPSPDSKQTGDLLFAMRSLTALLPAVLTAMVLASAAAVLIPNVVEGDTGVAEYSVYDTESVASSDSTSVSVGEAMINALVITAVLCGASLVLLALYKYRCGAFLNFYLGLSSLVLLGIMGGFMAFCALVGAQVPTDSLTFVLVFWNFGAVGVATVHYQSGTPAALGRAYLVLVSVIMAWHIVQLEEWTTWCLLVMLALYDLAAVLTPCGPLRWLVKIMQERGETMPGLLFETEVDEESSPPPPAAAPEQPQPQPRQRDGSFDETRSFGSSQSGEEMTTAVGAQQQLTLSLDPAQETVRVGAGSLGLLLDKRFQHLAVIKGFCATTGDERGDLELSGRVHPPAVIVRVDRISTSAMSLAEVAQILKQTAHQPQREIVLQNAAYVWTDSAADTGSALRASELPRARARKSHPVRLGLGDFVFYSVLAARAALFSVATLAASCVAVLMGLGVTLVALSVYRRALPALPTSIGFGCVAFVLARFVMVPEVLAGVGAGYVF